MAKDTFIERLNFLQLPYFGRTGLVKNVLFKLSIEIK